MNTMTVTVPLAIRRRGGRKVVVAPEGAAWAPARPRVDSTLVKALARAHRWKRLLECGRYASVVELAQAERINESYVCRLLRLTLLAPEIVDLILNGRQPAELCLPMLLDSLPIAWPEQHEVLINRATPPEPHHRRGCVIPFR